MSEELNALYFPEIVCLDENLLKYMILIYDRIYFLPNDIRLNPGHDTISKRFSLNDSILSLAFGNKNEVHKYTLYGCEEKNWDDDLKRLMSTYDLLEEQNICIPISDPTIEDFSRTHALEDSIKFDIQDSNFIDLCNKNINTRITLPDPSKYGEIKGGGFSMRSNRIIGQGGKVDVARQYDENKNYFHYLCSERINTALYISGKHNTVPVSKNVFFHNAINTKLGRIIKNPLFLDEKVFDEQKEKISINILNWQIIDQIIPVEAFQTKNIDQILKYKKESKELSLKFRDKVSRLELMVSQEPWDIKFEKEVNKIVSLEVVPEVEKLLERKKEIWRKLFDEAIKTTFSKKFLTASLGMNFVMNLNFLELLLYSTALWSSSILPNLIDLRREEQNIRKNALFYLINFSK